MKVILKIAVVIVALALIAGAVLLIGHFAGWFNVETDLIGDVKTHECGAGIMELDIDVGIADLSVETGDRFYIETNHKHVTMSEDGSAVKVAEDKFSVGLKVVNVPYIKVYLPKDAEFEKVNIKTSAGKVTVDALTAKEVQIKLSAGVAVFGQLNATKKAQIEGGAGSIQILKGTLNDLDMDLGAGATTVKSKLTGFATLDCGAGALELTLLGSKSDYALTVSKGVGGASVDGKTAEENKVYGEGDNQVRVNGGVGSIKVYFD